jgi:ribosomal-protein-serine acetyltransferase
MTDVKPIEIDGTLALRPFVPDDARELHRLIDRNLDHLREWLGWVDLDHSVSGKRTFIEGCRAQYKAGTGLQLALVDGDQLIGVLGFNTIDGLNHQGEIGYWLSADRGGSGVMTRAVRALVEHGFGPLELHRQMIRAATGNVRSRAIAERLGFTLEGIEREAELINGRYLDLARYVAFEGEWSAPAA